VSPKLIGYGLAALVVASLIAYEVRVHKKAAQRDIAVAELASATAQFKADVAALRAARDHELKIAKEASDGYQKDLARLERERDSIPVVRLRKCPPVSTAGTAASRPDAEASRRVGETTAEDTGPDIGAALIEYGIACEANMLQLERLQDWVRSR
jgi:hypothetical protein